LNAADLEKHPIFLGLGSNIEPAKNLPAAIKLLQQYVLVEAVSRAWETPAVGSKGPDFLNAAALIISPYQPEALKNRVIRIVEKQLGRVRSLDKNAPRPIDLDILLVDGIVVDPCVWEHAFLAVPLSDLIPEYRNPETGETLAQVALRLSRTTRIFARPEVLKL